MQGTAQDTADTDSAEKSTSGGAVLPTHSAKLQRHIVKVCFAVKLGAVVSDDHFVTYMCVCVVCVCVCACVYVCGVCMCVCVCVW